LLASIRRYQARLIEAGTTTQGPAKTTAKSLTHLKPG
jgi:hypothetical protein